MRKAKVVFSFTAGSILLTGMLVSSSTTPASCDSKTAVTKTAVTNRLIASSKMPTAKAGLLLLMSIFGRMGNAPQLANEKKQQAKETIAFQGQNLAQNQLFSQNTTDPALMIRPQEKNKAAGKGMQIQGLNIAMAPQSELSAYNEPVDKSAPARSEKSNGIWESDSSNLKKAMAPGANIGGVRGFAPASAPARANLAAKDSEQRGLSQESQRRISKALGGLAGTLQKIQEAQQMPSKIAVVPRQTGAFGDSYSSAGAPAAEESKESKNIKGYYKAGKGIQILDESPVIRDYRNIDTNAGNSAANRLVTAQHSAPKASAPSTPAASMDSFADEGSAAMKLDQPSAFKYNREYGSNSVPTADADDGITWNATKSKERADNLRGADMKRTVKREAELRRAREQVLTAYAPPSMVTGIPGLTLGSNEYETSRFLANRGDVLKETIDGWKVWTLRATGSEEPMLQVYIRANQVQGLRIFDRGLTPPGIGVTLGDGLIAMKERFGEPQFVLQESTDRGGKNYVYPVSQVSFQIAKSSGSALPKIVSLLLFKYI